MNYPKRCPICKDIIDSQDSVADTEAELRDHLNNLHGWDNRNQETGEHYRNGHILTLIDVEWMCVICRHSFDAAIDADLFECGKSCVHNRE